MRTVPTVPSPLHMLSTQHSKRSMDIVLSSLFAGNSASLQEWMDDAERISRESEQNNGSNPRYISSQVGKLGQEDLTTLCSAVDRCGFAHYAWNESPEDALASLNHLLLSLGLTNADQGIIRDQGELSLLQDLEGSPRGRFPAYRASAMNWHTDGYYNDPDDCVRCFSLHCLEPASQGGALILMDDRLLVFALLNEDPALVALLSHPQAMTLPRNRDDHGHNRPDRSVPIIHRNVDGALCMRFTTRTQHIQWRCDATKQAAQRALELINQNSQWHTHLCLKKGEGIITRNVLHAREAFVDAQDQPKRQILRGRFNDIPRASLVSKARNNPMADYSNAPR